MVLICVELYSLGLQSPISLTQSWKRCSWSFSRATSKVSVQSFHATEAGSGTAQADHSPGVHGVWGDRSESTRSPQGPRGPETGLPWFRSFSSPISFP